MPVPERIVTCPRCHREIPVGVLYGPCADCRAELRADVRTRFLAALERVATALADGWAWDDADACWRRGDEVRS